MFRGWKSGEGGTEVSPVVGQHLAPGRSANEQEEAVSLPGSLLMWDNAFLSCDTASALKPCEKGYGNVR